MSAEVTALPTQQSAAPSLPAHQLPAQQPPAASRAAQPRAIPPLVEPDPPAVPIAAPLLVALGDSVTFGVGDNPTGGGWSAHLADLIGAQASVIGRNGARARDVLAEQLPRALNSGAMLATVFVGGNDVLRGDFDIDEVEAALREVVQRLAATGVTVVLVCPPPVGADLPAPAVVRRVLGRRMDQVRAVILAIAAEPVTSGRQPILVDAEVVRERGGVGVFHIDRIHPSPHGHRLLARVVAEALAPLGWRETGVIRPAPAPPCLALKVAWLVVHGVPWVWRRSRDLLPELIRMVIAEERRHYRRKG